MIACQIKALIAEKSAREKRKISLREIQEATGISKSTISRMAAGKLTRYQAQTLESLCEYFNCGIGDLLEYRPTP